jgi:hypothetical protein
MQSSPMIMLGNSDSFFRRDIPKDIRREQGALGPFPELHGIMSSVQGREAIGKVLGGGTFTDCGPDQFDGDWLWCAQYRSIGQILD